MIITTMFQVLVTVWMGVHSVTYTIPKRYPATKVEACQEYAAELFAHRKDKNVRMTIECVPAVGSEA